MRNGILSYRKSIKNILSAMRLHQWAKNFLVFIPVIAAHEFAVSSIINSFYAFIAFSFFASSAYVLNDLIDVECDRKHPVKKKRVFASDRLSLKFGSYFCAILLVMGLLIAILLPMNFFLIAFSYFITTLLYTFYFKKIVLLDVFVLSFLYTVRIFAGSAATKIALSSWLLAFSIFLFLSLSIVKRVSELKLMQTSKRTFCLGRGYTVNDVAQMRVFGTVSGYISVLVLALYMNTEKVSHLYYRVNFLWLICLILLFWISRIWLIAERGQMNEDPLVFLLTDKLSLLLVVMVILCFFFAI